MSEKLGWFKFYPGDWARDLEEHPPEIEGYWIRVCCKLSWEPDRGRAVKSLEQWARVMRVIDLEEARRVIVYLRDAGIADVSGDPINPGEPIAIVSRRMVRDERERRGNAVRQERHRRKLASRDEDEDEGDASANRESNTNRNGEPNRDDNALDNPSSAGMRNAPGNGAPHPPRDGPGNGAVTPQNQESEQSKELFPQAPKRGSGRGSGRGGVRGGIPKLAETLGDEGHRLHELALWFEEILWPAYPPRRGRKTGKTEAWEWLARDNPDESGLNRIQAKLREDLASQDWRRGIGIKDCHRWLRANQKNGWESTLAPREPGDDPYEGLDD